MQRETMVTGRPKCVSSLHLSVDIEGWRFFSGENLKNTVDNLNTVDYWLLVEKTFINPSNNNLFIYVFVTRKESKKRLNTCTKKEVFGASIQLSVQFPRVGWMKYVTSEIRKKTLIRSRLTFTKILYHDIQRQPLQESVELRWVLNPKSNMESGIQNNQQCQIQKEAQWVRLV